MEYQFNPWCLTLSEDMMDSRDFRAEDVIELDYSLQLPKHFSLWERVYKTNYQNGRWSCTSNATSHGFQVLKVEEKWVKPVNANLITPDWKDLWTKMWHDLNNKNDSGDYVEKAINTALKEWIATEEGWVINIDWYTYQDWTADDKWIELLKRYLYEGFPIVRCLRWNATTWKELTAWTIKSVIQNKDRNWGHAVCLVGRDEWWFWFLNSWRTNDGKWFKSRFYVPYQFLKMCQWMFNWRYRPLFIKWLIRKDPAYILRKNRYAAAIKELKANYPEESRDIQAAIENLSKLLRKKYPELNEEVPL